MGCPVGEPYSAYPSLRPEGRVRVWEVSVSRRKRHVGGVWGFGGVGGGFFGVVKGR